MIRIAIIAAAPAIRAGLRALLTTTTSEEERIEIIFEAAHLAAFEDDTPGIDVLLLSVEAYFQQDLGKLTNRPGEVAILLLTDDPHSAQSLAGLPLRAWGVLPLESSKEELEIAIRALHLGLWIGPKSLLQAGIVPLSTAGFLRSETQIEPLTGRESQVLQLLSRGLANKQIARALGISEHTVKFHIASIYSKLGATNRAEAVRLGIQQGLASL